MKSATFIRHLGQTFQTEYYPWTGQFDNGNGNKPAAME